MTTPKLTADQALLLDNQLCFALYSASLAMTKLYKPLLDEMGRSTSPCSCSGSATA
jgi:MarR family transcriptional regulator, organic hydroperoxide resistance regulator